jgi:hypothetical protein
MTFDSKHIQYIQGVCDDDARILHEKEKTYQGSWKKRGGVGAFMMLARKWDRLENQVQPHGLDILKAVMEDGGTKTKDGILDDVADLRRYLTLVEAEIRALEDLETDLQGAGAAPVPPPNVRVGPDGQPKETKEEECDCFACSLQRIMKNVNNMSMGLDSKLFVNMRGNSFAAPLKIGVVKVQGFSPEDQERIKKALAKVFKKCGGINTVSFDDDQPDASTLHPS